MPPPRRNGMYAAYSAARSRMLSDSTPGRASWAPAAVAAGILSAIIRSSPKQLLIFKQQRFGDEARLQRVRDLRALLQQRAMITKQRQRRHHGRKWSERRGIVAVLERRSTGLRGREIGAPRSEPVNCRADERLAAIARR